MRENERSKESPVVCHSGSGVAALGEGAASRGGPGKGRERPPAPLPCPPLPRAPHGAPQRAEPGCGTRGERSGGPRACAGPGAPFPGCGAEPGSEAGLSRPSRGRGARAATTPALPTCSPSREVPAGTPRTPIPAAPPAAHTAHPPPPPLTCLSRCRRWTPSTPPSSRRGHHQQPATRCATTLRRVLLRHSRATGSSRRRPIRSHVRDAGGGASRASLRRHAPRLSQKPPRSPPVASSAPCWRRGLHFAWRVCKFPSRPRGCWYLLGFDSPASTFIETRGLSIPSFFLFFF